MGRSYYMAQRVADRKVPLVPANKGRCGNCDAEVWLSKQRDPAIFQQMLILCYQCAETIVGPAEVLPAQVLDKKGPTS